MPTEADDSGFYEDANGIEYFLDKNGREHYKTDIPDNADFGFFEDEDGVAYFVDQDGVEHYRHDDLVATQQAEVQHTAMPNPEDESGFYEDVDGVEYYLDKDGIEYYQNPKDGEWYAHGGQKCEEGRKCLTIPSRPVGNTTD